MLIPPGGYVEIDAFDALVGNLFWSPIAIIRAARHRFGSCILFDLLEHRRQLLLVVDFLRDVGGDDDLRFGIHRDLRVVGLYEAAFVRSVDHNPAVRIGEVALRAILWLGLLRIGNLRRPPADFLSRLLLLLLPLGNSHLGLSFLLLRFPPRFHYQRRLRLGDFFQPALPPRQFRRQLVAVTLPLHFIFGRVDGFSALEQFLHLRSEPFFRFSHPPITPRLVLAGVRLQAQGDELWA